VADRHAAPTPLIGEDDRALSAMLTDLFTDAKPPEDAIPADEAARIILDGVAGGGESASSRSRKARKSCGANTGPRPRRSRHIYRISPETRRIAFAPGDAEALYRPARPAAQA
jgi:hypothetical protein